MESLTGMIEEIEEILYKLKKAKTTSQLEKLSNKLYEAVVDLQYGVENGDFYYGKEED